MHLYVANFMWIVRSTPTRKYSNDRTKHLLVYSTMGPVQEDEMYTLFIRLQNIHSIVAIVFYFLCTIYEYKTSDIFVPLKQNNIEFPNCYLYWQLRNQVEQKPYVYKQTRNLLENQSDGYKMKISIRMDFLLNVLDKKNNEIVMSCIQNCRRKFHQK